MAKTWTKKTCGRCGYKVPKGVDAELVIMKCVNCGQDCCPVCGPQHEGGMCKKCALESLTTEFNPLAS